MAVLPSAESETPVPCVAIPMAPVPTSLAPCWLHTPPERVYIHAAPVSPLSPYPPTDGGIPVAGKRDRRALSLKSAYSTCADQFSALLAPHPARVRKHPRGAGVAVVKEPTHDGSIAVAGERDRPALMCGPTAPVPTKFGPCWVNCACASVGIRPRTSMTTGKLRIPLRFIAASVGVDFFSLRKQYRDQAVAALIEINYSSILLSSKGVVDEAR